MILFTVTPKSLKSDFASSFFAGRVSLVVEGHSPSSTLKATTFIFAPLSTGKVRTCPSCPIYRQNLVSVRTRGYSGHLHHHPCTYVHFGVLSQVIAEFLDSTLHWYETAVGIRVCVGWWRARTTLSH